MNAGLVGGIIGAILGLVGGAIGTYFSITNTKGPLERAFMVKASIVTWVVVLLFIGLVYFLPNPYRYLLWIPYGILLQLGIARMNKRVAKIRELEGSV